MAVAVRLAISFGLKYWKEITIGIVFLLGTIFTFFFSWGIGSDNNNFSGVGPGGEANVSPLVIRYEPVLKEYAAKYGVDESYIPIIEALMMQESGGKGGDPMQSSESIGLPPNTIDNPIYSIEMGMKAFKDVLTKAKGDISTVLQSYNFGKGFIDYIQKNGGVFTQALVNQFSSMMAQKNGWASYGDTEYVAHVLRYYQAPDMPPTYVLSPSDGKPMPYFDKLMKVALQFQGMPYQWGGHIPATSFDCSGLVEYSFAQIGINMPRTAQEQYNATKRISKEQLQPGDLVFFTKTYDGAPFISHVGIYVGDNKMYNSNSKGISYSDLTSKKWTEHLVGFGRIGGF